MSGPCNCPYCGTREAPTGEWPRCNGCGRVFLLYHGIHLAAMAAHKRATVVAANDPAA